MRLADCVEELRYARTTTPGHELVLSPDGEHLLRLGMDLADVWRTRDGTLARTIKLAPRGWSGTSVFTPDGATLVVATKNHAVLLYDFARGRALATLAPPADLGEIFGCTAVRVDPRGRFFVASYWTAAGAELCAWSLATRAPCARLSWALPGHGRPSALALDHDGTLLVAGSSSGSLACWDLSGMAPDATRVTPR